MLTPHPTYSVHVLDGVAFGQARTVEGALETLHLDVYLPQGAPHGLRPCVLWFHGGGFRPGHDRKQIYIPMFANALAARGVVGIAPDYRLRANPGADLPGTIRDAMSDARAALAWTREHTAAYDLDADRIALAGGSAGGMAVLNLVHEPGAGIHAGADGAWAVLDMWGTPGGPGRLFAGVNPHSPPTLIVHGTADELVPYDWSRGLAGELAQAGVDCELLSLEGAPHTPIRAHFDRIVEAMVRFLNAR